MKQRIGIAVLGLGWMGQAHSRAALRIPSLFPDAKFKPELVVCADTEQSRRDRAVNDLVLLVQFQVLKKPLQQKMLMQFG